MGQGAKQLGITCRTLRWRINSGRYQEAHLGNGAQRQFTSEQIQKIRAMGPKYPPVEICRVLLFKASKNDWRGDAGNLRRPISQQATRRPLRKGHPTENIVTKLDAIDRGRPAVMTTESDFQNPRKGLPGRIRLRPTGDNPTQYR